MSASGWPQWIAERMRLLGFRTSSELARAAGIPVSVISRWRSGSTTPSLVQLRRLQGPLRATLLELLVAAEILTAQEAQLSALPEQPAPAYDVRESLRRDPALTEDLRRVLELQYDALLALAAARAGDRAVSST